ncbi:NadR type nicotinamide-nucleotide adenylyltransferase [Sphingomonas vulcanisoli]|uniref:NadR type nicotinamide-nucleotide adenylyltransferase n=1 Tax=Sphingomonas vulcanisoli TaxID=1658060 RepID=A0ABX0TUP4_9SPHN|nr:AAA family ATPase [Sphingomonas vulcanisoli]NIJ08112.1 NadR type nicotinamide-nucleotide adenylyltransferase [Sphingomonas vulcanisoli]
MTTGLIVGRFMPPHAGHMLLAGTARALVDHLVLAMIVGPEDAISPADRAAWMAELFPQAELVQVHAAPSGTDHWWEPMRAQLGRRIDLVFAGDGEALALASALGARYVQLDPEHQTLPISGAEILADLMGNWRFLPAPVRERFARTICLHGPESTGKSTLAPQLAAHFDTCWLPEYGRTYCETFGLALTMADLLAIGRTHAAMTRAAKRLSSGRLILDTDPLMTAAWADMLFERSDPWFDHFDETADLYLLLDIDMPWVDDGTRFFGDEGRRRRFFECSRHQLEKRGLPYVLIGGPAEERLARSIEAIAAAGL